MSRGVWALAGGVMLLAVVGAGVYAGVRWHAERAGPGAGTGTERPVAQERTYRSTMGDAFLDVRVAIDRSELNVAERVNLDVTAEARTGATITMPPIGERVGDFNVAAVERSERLVSPGTKEVAVHAVLEPFLAGDKTVPAMEVRAQDGATKLSAKTESIPVLVVAVVPGATEKTPLEPALPPMALASAQKRSWVLPAAIGAGALCLLAGGIVVMRRGSGRGVDPAAAARARIEAVRAGAPGASPEQASGLAAELHAAFATYLDSRWRIPATTRTPGEVHASVVGHSALTPDVRAEIAALLVDLERTRFAPGAATGPAVERLADRCLGVIDRAAQQAAQGVAA